MLKYSRTILQIMAKLQFYPTDITYKIVEGKPQIRLFARTVDGKQVILTDDTFQPYFYVIPKSNDVRDKIEKIAVDKDERIIRAVKTETIKKRHLGKEVDAIRVYLSLPKDVPIFRDIIKGWEIIEGIYEYDILFARRYLIDKGIALMTLYEAEVEPYNLRLKVPAYKFSEIKEVSSDPLTPRILSVDIETYSPSKNIDPEKNPIIMIALHGKDYQKVFTWKKFKTKHDYVEFVGSEFDLIEKFKEALNNYKPDILTGYFSDGFDLPYINTRAKKYKIKLDLGLDNSELIIDAKNVPKARIKGIIHLDVFRFIRRILGAAMHTDSYNLNAVAEELLGEKKDDVKLEDLPKVWDDEPSKLEPFIGYNLRDAVLTYNLAEKVMPTAIELVKIVGLSIFEISRMGFSQLVEWYLLRQLPNYNEVAPNKPRYDEIRKRRTQHYKGGFVFKPNPGLYQDIVVFDFRSLYPTIVSSHNISPGTLNCECCKDSAKRSPTDEEYYFCNNKKGFIPSLIEDLITRRMRIKEIIKKSSDEELSFLDARQNALKLLANSFYGYLGFYGARWYCLECAKATTAWGRHYIQDVIKKAQDKGFLVLYSDTDSIFLSLKGKTNKDANLFVEKINSELPGLMELENEGFYPSGIFVSAKIGDFGAKKKYALMSEDGTLKVKGFESVRRNWSLIAKEAQEEVLNIILKENDKEKAVNHVKKIIGKLRDNKIDVERVIINTQLQKNLSDYSSKGPHVVVAERMQSQGISVGPGLTVQYVVTVGGDTIGSRSKLPSEVTKEDYDPDYYISNQVIPAVESIFKVIGYSKEDLLEHKEQKKLDGFFG